MVFSLRASVANTCNMGCAYCPRWTSMEDYSPQGLQAEGLSNENYIQVITNLAQSIPLSSISLTGGEPLFNKQLHEIVAAVRPHTQRLELNTNGILLTPKRWEELSPFIDRVKISMDSTDPTQFQKITGLQLSDGLEKVKKAICLIRDSGVSVAVNCVVMNSNISELAGVIDWAKEQQVRLHLLDFYYTDERRDIWEKEFVPLENVIPALSKKYGKPEIEDVFGCQFLTFNFEEETAALRLKTSFSGTMRSQRCEACSHYCQEGLYSLKLSQKGWVTTCPSNEEEDGSMLNPEWDIEQTKTAITWMLEEEESAKLSPNSFTDLIERNDLNG